VAWLRVDTQTILTIATHVITKNHRIGVTHSDHRTWYLQIRDVRESDRGWYMCQINTDPMKSQIGYLEVVVNESSGLKKNTFYQLILFYNSLSYIGNSRHTNTCLAYLTPTPRHFMYERSVLTLLLFNFSSSQLLSLSISLSPLPPFLRSTGRNTILLLLQYRCHLQANRAVQHSQSSKNKTRITTDMVVREGTNVTLRCAATGSPQPSITWRREGGETIPLGNGQETTSVEGPVFNITRVNRLHMGPYLCIASNGVPPTVSKRIMLIVHFPPMIWIQNQLVGAYEGQQMTLECNSEAYPKSINYWARDKGEIIAQGGKYEPVLLDNAYKVHMKLMIRAVGPTDFGSYKCVSKNSLGDTDGSIKLYR
ncbi:hypothetical protein L798_08507, partial [Zootermopsis nevadensis]